MFQVLSSARLPKDADCLTALHPVRTSGGREDLPGVPAALGNCNQARHGVVPGRTGPPVPRTSLQRPSTFCKGRSQRRRRNGLFNLEIFHCNSKEKLIFPMAVLIYVELSNLAVFFLSSLNFRKDCFYSIPEIVPKLNVEVITKLILENNFAFVHSIHAVLAAIINGTRFKSS